MRSWPPGQPLFATLTRYPLPPSFPERCICAQGLRQQKERCSKINGPTTTHMASGRTLSIIDDIAQTGTAVVGVSSEDDLTLLKEKCRNRLTILGNLNGVAMCRWSTKEAEHAVKQIIDEAAEGGGLIISDNHGEIPFQVEEEILHALSDAVKRWGIYPTGTTRN